MKALHMLFQMRYGSLLSSRRLQSTIQKCRGHLVEASPTPKATKWPKVWCGLKCIKSDIFKENVAQYLNLGHLETAKQISRKLVGPGLRNLSWKKGGLAVSKTTVHWELARNKGCWTFWPVTWPFLGVELAIIPHLKEGYLGYLLIKIFWIFSIK